MRPLKSLISLDEALKIISENLKIIEDTENVTILQLCDRVAAQDIIAQFDVPPFERAAMDGYAVKATSTYVTSETTPVVLTCIEQIHAGEVPLKKINEKECSEIATGAMIPDSADAVVPVEFTNQKGKNIEILKIFPPKANVSKKGVDIRQGEIVIKKGQIYTPARIGILAALNLQSALVFRKPKIALIPTGREIAPLGTPLKPGQVYDINSYTLSVLVQQHGGDPVIYDIVPDQFDSLEKSILDALKFDLIIILGGSSVGERDINIDIIQKHGKIFFHGIQLKPGKPTLCGKIQETFIINLPGYPTSCLTNGYILLLPALHNIAQLPNIPRKTVHAKLARKIVGTIGRHQIYTVKLENGFAVPAFKESGAITSMAWADGYIEIPYNLDYVDKNEDVEVVLF